MGRVVVVDSRQVVPCEAVVGIGVAVVVSLVAFVTFVLEVLGHQMAGQVLQVGGNHQLGEARMGENLVGVLTVVVSLGLVVVLDDELADQDVALVVPVVDTSFVVSDIVASSTDSIACTEHTVVDSFRRMGFVRHSYLVVCQEVGCRC